VTLAVADGRKRSELELRLDRGALSGEPSAAEQLAAVKREASALGLLAIAGRAGEPTALAVSPR